MLFIEKAEVAVFENYFSCLMELSREITPFLRSFLTPYKVVGKVNKVSSISINKLFELQFSS